MQQFMPAIESAEAKLRLTQSAAKDLVIAIRETNKMEGTDTSTVEEDAIKELERLADPDVFLTE